MSFYCEFCGIKFPRELHLQCCRAMLKTLKITYNSDQGQISRKTCDVSENEFPIILGVCLFSASTVKLRYMIFLGGVMEGGGFRLSCFFPLFFLSCSYIYIFGHSLCNLNRECPRTSENGI